jgi:hypothetical protein
MLVTVSSKRGDPITLPLVSCMKRCEGFGDGAIGSVCDRRDGCARYLTREVDDVQLPSDYRVCTTSLMVGFVPIEGWKDLVDD